MTKPTVSEKVRVVIFPPDAIDGEHWCPVEINDSDGILNCINGWATDAELGAEITLKVKTMTKRELERLPSI